MTPEAQRIAIAEACGWKQIENADGDLTEPHLTRCWTEWLGPNGEQSLEPPDYLQDLNAMHEAENTLFGIECENYARMLTGAGLLFYPVAHANAVQRAEAFLRVKGLWK